MRSAGGSWTRKAGNAVSDIWTIARRDLLHFRRRPLLLLSSIVYPLGFLVTMNLVFGNAIAVPPGRYLDYTLPGAMALSVVAGGMGSGLRVAEDSRTGMMDRLRALPVARSAPVVGRVVSDMLRSVPTLFLLIAVAVLMGARLTTSPARILPAVGILVLFGAATSTCFGVLGLRADSGAAIATASGAIYLLFFASAAFTPLAAMPGAIQDLVAAHPVTATTDAVRNLISRPWSAAGFHPLGPAVSSVVWSSAIVLCGLQLSRVTRRGQ